MVEQNPSGIQHDGTSPSDTPIQSEGILPSNVRHKFVFERHVAITHEDYGIVKNGLTQQMQGIFVPKQRNILFLESFDGINPLVLSEYKKRKSLRGANLVDSVLRETKRYPSGKDIERTLAVWNERVKLITDPIARYGWAVSHAVDAVNSLGYRIELQYERPTPEAHPYYEHDKPRTLEEYQTMMRDLAVGSSMRNATMAEQLTEFTDEAGRSGQETNIMALFGSSHVGILQLLPKAYESASNADISVSDIGAPIIDEVNMRLAYGDEVDEELWGKAFQEYRRLG